MVENKMFSKGSFLSVIKSCECVVKSLMLFLAVMSLRVLLLFMNYLSVDSSHQNAYSFAIVHIQVALKSLFFTRPIQTIYADKSLWFFFFSYGSLVFALSISRLILSFFKIPVAVN